MTDLSEFHVTGLMGCDCCVDIHHTPCEAEALIDGGGMADLVAWANAHQCGGQEVDPAT